MRYFKLIAVSVSCAAIISGLVAWQVHRAKANHRLVDDAKASRVNAEHGDAAAELTLAHMYYYGQDVAQDYIEAARWYRKAADQGEAKGQYGLGYMYYNGQGVPHDYAEAVRWYHKAADQGDARAEVNLALTYYNGQGVSQDYAEAVRWYRKATDQGDAMAQDGLGLMYYRGQGVQQDYTEAARWYRKAADQGFAKAQYDLGVMYYHDQGVQQDRAEANRWLHKAANQGNENAQLTLSVGLTMWRKLFLLTQFACGVLLMVWFFRQRRSRWSPRRVDLPLTGILCLFTAGLSWYGYIHHLIWCVTCGFSAFTWFKWLLNAVLIALLVYILRPGRISPTA
jgi:TPR repeat protein